jgi:hypothetical protein
MSWTVENQLHRFAIEDALPFGAPNGSTSEITSKAAMIFARADFVNVHYGESS